MKIFPLLIVLIFTGCTTQPFSEITQTEKIDIQPEAPHVLQPTQQKTPSDDTQPDPVEQLLRDGFTALSRRKTKIAVDKYFDKAIALCNEKYSGTHKKIYASRTLTETMFYMLKAASEKQEAIAISSACSEAFYLKGYASLDMGNIELAEKSLYKAIEMSPVNARYLSELGHIYQLSREWERALEYFRKAEQYATTYSPPAFKTLELSRAKRGIGYVLIEQGKLDAAEAKFRESLALDSNDKVAKNELMYIEKLRNNIP